METPRKRSRPGRRGRVEPDVVEWVGGRMISPFYVTEGTPFRPEMIVWLQLPEDLIVFLELIDPKEPPLSFGESLLRAMEAAPSGPVRRPEIIRVADADLAAEVRQVLPGIQVVEAPAPELDSVLVRMVETMPDGEDPKSPSYYEEGRVSAEGIEDFFRAAEALYHVAPWKVAADSQALRVDIPAYGVEGGCLSIIGALGESLGFLLFPSFEGFERFIEAAGVGHTPGGPIDVGTTCLSLNYEAGCDLPASMFREALEHGWPVAEARAYPMIQHRDRDAVVRPLTERDYRVVAACAASLASFVLKHGHLFKQDLLDEPICESFFDDDDIEVRFTLPYEAWDLFEVNQPRRPPEKPVRRSSPAGRRPSERGRPDVKRPLR